MSRPKETMEDIKLFGKDEDYGEAYNKGYEQGFSEGVAAHNRWYIEDADGREMFLGDLVKPTDEDTLIDYEVVGLGHDSVFVYKAGKIVRYPGYAVKLSRYPISTGRDRYRTEPPRKSGFMI